MEILLTGLIDDLSGLIETCSFLAEALFLVEMLPRHIVEANDRQHLLRFAHFNKEIDFASYTSGRFFRPDYELRWAQIEGKTHVIYLGEERAIPDLRVPDDITLRDYKIQSANYYLFGEKLKEPVRNRRGVLDDEIDFADARVPRLLRYPVSPEAQRVRIIVREYVHKATGRVELFRFEGLEAMGG